MKYLKKVLCLLLLFAAVSLVGCRKNKFDQVPTELAVTLDAQHISCFSAILAGKANLDNPAAPDVEMGIVYSTSADLAPSNSVVVKAEETEGSGNYALNVTGLEPETAYYFRSYVFHNGDSSYGETKSFTTRALSYMIRTKEAIVENPSDAKLIGYLDLTDCPYESVSYGFYHGEEENKVARNYYRLTAETFDENQHEITYMLRGIPSGAIHYFKAYVCLDGKYYYGDILNFTTDAIVASVETNDATDVGIYSATISGSLTYTGEKDYNKFPYFLYSDSANTLEALIESGKKVSVNWGDNGSFTATLMPIMHNTTFYYVAVSGVYDQLYYGEVKQFKTSNYPYVAQAVDLGLSVKWSSYNLGADTPEGCGAYFAWGETEPKIDYDWNNYKYCIFEGQDIVYTKYCTKSECGVVDNLVELLPEDDAATAKLGGNWHIPTRADWLELLDTDNCSREFATINDVMGFKFTSKKPGHTNESIFLPSAGEWIYDEGPSIPYLAGYYWSSSLYVYYPGYASIYDFEFNRMSDIGDRPSGLSIRPVTN